MHWPDVSNRDFTLSSILFAGNNNASGTMIDDKSKQWFGASVHSSGQDGIIVVRFTFNFVYYWSLRLGIQSDIPITSMQDITRPNRVEEETRRQFL